MASSRPAPPPPPPQPQIDHLLSQFPITPKPDPDGPTPVPDAAALMLALTPELCDALHRELDPSPDDDPYFARCLRQSQLHLEALAARLHAPSSSSAPAARVPPPPPPPLPQKERQMQPRQEPGAGAGGSKSSPSGSKKRARGITEVVRATRLSAGDHLRYRALVRRARLTFEALRGAYQREETSSGARNRHDLRASSQMLAAGHWLHREVRFVGDIPGVQVGDAFYYRAEICVVGLHTAPQAGIGWIPGSHFDEGHPIATSIVSSGGYMDDEDTGDVLYYTGSGGRQRNRLDHHSDQTLERGNLALHNSYQFGVEVRVIRGHDIDQGPHRKVYVYDGLYRVVESTFGPGKSGHDVCKFKLVRLPGQDELASKTWHTAKLLKADMDNRIRPRGYISLDLSKGAEVLRVPVCNKLDKDRDRSPLLFEYTVRPEFPVPPPPVKQHRGCHCAASCGSKCRCERKNGGGPVYTEDETLVMGRPVVYECGAQCGCPMTCVNRVTQRGMKHRLEVFRSNETGWGVRALDLIQPGAFVCEYTGQVVAMDGQQGSALMEGRSIINPRTFPERWREWGDASAIEPDMKMRQFAKVAVAGPGYVLDVSQKRNVACYISHSCTPNVFLQYVLRGNENESFPHLMVFAMETIPPMRELSIDYGIDGDLIASLC